MCMHLLMEDANMAHPKMEDANVAPLTHPDVVLQPKTSNDTCAWTPISVSSNFTRNLIVPVLVASEAPEGNFLGSTSEDQRECRA